MMSARLIVKRSSRTISDANPAAHDPVCRELPTVRTMAAIFDLNHHATYVHWHFIDVSVSNLIVVGVMLVVFAAAILLPFPKSRESRSGT
jgi:hypothetical protein